MKYAARADANQPKIIQALKDVGASVTSLHRVGMGCPDLLVGFRNKNFLLELKDGEKPPSARKLTPPQERWHDMWAGQAVVVSSVGGALAAIGAVE